MTVPFEWPEAALGAAYWHGYGVAVDYGRAVYWYSKAAEHGNAGAENGLGLAYSQGLGVPVDLARAVEWYRRAAVQNEPYAEANLGRAYALGSGVEKSAMQAVIWFRKAARICLLAPIWPTFSTGRPMLLSHSSVCLMRKSSPPWVAASQSFSKPDGTSCPLRQFRMIFRAMFVSKFGPHLRAWGSTPSPGV